MSNEVIEVNRNPNLRELIVKQGYLYMSLINALISTKIRILYRNIIHEILS